MKLKIICFTYCLFISINSTSFSQDYYANGQIFNELDIALDSLYINNGYTGISTAFLLPDGRIWTRAIGYSNISTLENLDTLMLLSGASITKTFTSSLILELLNENFLNLSDSLYQWLPSYKNIDTTITIKQLLNHTSGIYDYSENVLGKISIFLDPEKIWKPEEILGFVEEPYFDPGTDWKYSNTNYILLGMIAEKIIDNSTVSNELRQRFFNKYNLNHTFFEIKEEIPDSLKIAHGYIDVNNDGIKDDIEFFSRNAIYSAAWAAGAIVSTPKDLVNWANYLFNGNVINQNLLDKMIDFEPVDLPESSHIIGYGLGLMQYNINNYEFWGHSGNIPGFTSELVYSPELEIILCVLINENDANINYITKTLVSTFTSFNTSINRYESKNISNFEMLNTYPNPFNPLTHIVFKNSIMSNVAISIYNLKGQLVEIVYDQQTPVGTHNVLWNASEQPSGTYFIKMIAGEFQQIQKCILIK